MNPLIIPFNSSNCLAQLLQSSKEYEHFCLLNSNAQYNCEKSTISNEYVLAIGSINSLSANGNCLEKLDAFIRANAKKWIFGYLSYDIKNEIEQLTSNNHDGLGFPLIHFFVPKYVVEIKNNTATIHSQSDENNEKEIEALINYQANPTHSTFSIQNSALSIQARTSHSEYISAVNKIKKHIQLGDIYEINYCMEFFAEDANINPAETYLKLNNLTEAPFSAFYKNGYNYALCGSPERFIKKEGPKISSQPIKGTAKRFEDKETDELSKKELFENEKERSENVMIVDLVRNDLSKIATKASVRVDELFGVYTFKSVHQLISTVSAELKPDLPFIEIIKALFPMGSMTGAPKIRAMQLIEQYEKTKRGLYSGSIGYIKPNGNFDFNVVIRSILYNKQNKYLSFSVGSAITANCEAEKEYEECLLKAEALAKALG